MILMLSTIALHVCEAGAHRPFWLNLNWML